MEIALRVALDSLLEADRELADANLASEAREDEARELREQLAQTEENHEAEVAQIRSSTIEHESELERDRLEATTALAGARGTMQHLREEMDEMRMRLHATQKELGAAKADNLDLSRCRDELASTTAELASARTELMALRAEFGKSERLHTQSEFEASQALAQVERLREANVRLGAELSAMEAAKRNALDDGAAARRKLERLLTSQTESVGRLKSNGRALCRAIREQLAAAAKVGNTGVESHIDRSLALLTSLVSVIQAKELDAQLSQREPDLTAQQKHRAPQEAGATDDRPAASGSLTPPAPPPEASAAASPALSAPLHQPL